MSKLETAARTGATMPGLTFRRNYTTPDVNPLDSVQYETRHILKKDKDGKVLFELEETEFPKEWSQLAGEIAAEKYFKRAEVPGTGTETSARQMV